MERKIVYITNTINSIRFHIYSEEEKKKTLHSIFRFQFSFDALFSHIYMIIFIEFHKEKWRRDEKRNGKFSKQTALMATYVTSQIC